MRGKIITLEGNDRVGKRTQSRLLADYIRNIGYDVKTVSFPNYGTEQSKPVEYYLAGNFPLLGPIEASLLYAFDRSVTFREMNIKGFLKNGGVLILDRYTTSNITFQIARSFRKGEEIDVRNDKSFSLIYRIEQLEYNILELPRPDAVVYLKLDRKAHHKLLDADHEIKGIKNDIHESDTELLDRVSEVGIQLARLCGWNIVDCYDKEKDSIYSKEEVLEKIVNGLSDKLNILPKQEKI